jgi:hypothetical protein
VQQALQSVISPLLIYRLAFGVAAIFIHAEGYLADARIDHPGWQIDQTRIVRFRRVRVPAEFGAKPTSLNVQTKS